ncbi:MAG: alanine--tRNA ligase [Acidimicrobiia bacterium]|nr:alanine--tRNA ligase [Acidimicrobiia bacterium]MBT8192231.1 alanine--tRNA ligase [Acidimicrobiia bacterium]NNL97975.1 alanine--tRNA ligase [Acidimicrobiia bacterium]
MDHNAIRNGFIDFFVERGHTRVPSASLIPPDPTLLLTNAGMVQFKPYMLGEEKPPYPRAVTVQKVARTSDIDIIGTTARHLTFFEMLGNFSFGDYFKEKAIPYAYDLITEVFGLDPDRLWYTIYNDDDEAAEIWLDGVGVPPDRLQRRDRDNFWQMGVPGPCGPSSEVFYDKGPEYGPDGGPVVDEERFTEIWNLVFMQNVQDEPYHVVGDLPAKNIDTGAGLERIAMVLQQKDTVFEIDTLVPIREAGEQYVDHRYGDDEQVDISLRILADHGRAMTFLINDGVVPSNEGRGYVLRRLIRRAVRRAWTLGGTEPVTRVLIEATIEMMKDAYPELHRGRDHILDSAGREEESFRRTLETGSALLDAELDKVSDVLPGTVAFKLHDTYGFPVEVTTEIAEERGVAVDREGFDAEMDQQREKAKKAWKGSDVAAEAEEYRKVLDGVDLTDFLGYEFEDSVSRIVALLRDGESVESLSEGEEGEVFLDRTPFYAEAGGQVGDSGTVWTETGSAVVTDTQFAIQGINSHRVKVAKGTIRLDQEANAEIDRTRRERIRKSHTGTHILHSALRSVLGDHARQAGSLVEAGRLRFDFSHHAALDPDELGAVEALANDHVIENARVTSFETSKQEAEAMGAIAFFGDKYGETVRVVEAGSFSRELCGGTHTSTTGQVGPLIVTSEGSIGSNMRRVEALTGSAAYEHIVGLRTELEGVASALQTGPGNVGPALTALLKRSKDQEERLDAFEDRYRAETAGSLTSDPERVGSSAIVVAAVPGASSEDLRLLAFQARDKVKSGIVVLGTERGGKAQLVAVVSSDLVGRGVSARSVIAGPAGVVGGGGGGDDEVAQAGGPNGENLSEALAAAGDELRTLLTDL